MVPVVALAWKREAIVLAARSRLNAIMLHFGSRIPLRDLWHSTTT